MQSKLRIVLSMFFHRNSHAILAAVCVALTVSFTFSYISQQMEIARLTNALQERETILGEMKQQCNHAVTAMQQTCSSQLERFTQEVQVVFSTQQLVLTRFHALLKNLTDFPRIAHERYALLTVDERADVKTQLADWLYATHHCVDLTLDRHVAEQTTAFYRWACSSLVYIHFRNHAAQVRAVLNDTMDVEFYFLIAQLGSLKDAKELPLALLQLFPSNFITSSHPNGSEHAISAPTRDTAATNHLFFNIGRFTQDTDPEMSSEILQVSNVTRTLSALAQTLLNRTMASKDNLSMVVAETLHELSMEAEALLQHTTGLFGAATKSVTTGLVSMTEYTIAVLCRVMGFGLVCVVLLVWMNQLLARFFHFTGKQ